jgi:4a-hydroxytetrahydrobiopterin dehydratase
MQMTREEASAAVNDLGWRYILGTYRASVPVASLAEAAGVAARAAAVPDAQMRLRVDIRHDQAIMTVAPPGAPMVTGREVALVHGISALGFAFGPPAVQMLEIAVDAMDIPAVRPFWRAAFGYADETDDAGSYDALVDPRRQGPAIWFQQMDAPREQRNRIHFDVTVPHDEVAARLAATLEAGGTLVSDAYAPSFWVLADVEGNEVCLCTWQGRD